MYIDGKGNHLQLLEESWFSALCANVAAVSAAVYFLLGVPVQRVLLHPAHAKGQGVLPVQ